MRRLLEDLKQEDLLHLLVMSELMPGRFDWAAVQDVLQLNEYVTDKMLERMDAACLLHNIHDSSTKQRLDADGKPVQGKPAYRIVLVVRELLK